MSSALFPGKKRNHSETTNYQHHFQNRLNGDLFQFMPHSFSAEERPWHGEITILKPNDVGPQTRDFTGTALDHIRISQRLPLLLSVSVPRSTEDAKSRHLLVRNHCLLFLRLGLGGPCVSLSSCVSPPGTMGNLGKSRSRKSNIANGFGTFAGISAPACKLNPLPEKGMCAAATGDHPVLLSIVVVPF